MYMYVPLSLCLPTIMVFRGLAGNENIVRIPAYLIFSSDACQPINAILTLNTKLSNEQNIYAYRLKYVSN